MSSVSTTRAPAVFQQPCRVLGQRRLCPRYLRLDLEAAWAPRIQPGQFVHLRTGERWEPFFRRPFSVFDVVGNTMSLFYEVVGPGTARMARWRRGDEADVLGPLGRSFSRPPEDVEEVVMVAGGIGVAPFLLLSRRLKAWKPHVRRTLLYGVRDAGGVFDAKPFQRLGVAVRLATQDGSAGVKGLVTRLLKGIAGRRVFIYTCGPNPMMAAVQALARRRDWPGEAACEEVMACGLGACLGCSIPMKHGGYKTVCCDGPVFDLHEVDFEALLQASS